MLLPTLILVSKELGASLLGTRVNCPLCFQPGQMLPESSLQAAALLLLLSPVCYCRSTMQ